VRQQERQPSAGAMLCGTCGDGTIMPMKKGQPPPDLKYFKQTQK
jgi:hypothetical protein